MSSLRLSVVDPVYDGDFDYGKLEKFVLHRQRDQQHNQKFNPKKWPFQHPTEGIFTVNHRNFHHFFVYESKLDLNTKHTAVEAEWVIEVLPCGLHAELDYYGDHSEKSNSHDDCGTEHCRLLQEFFTLAHGVQEFPLHNGNEKANHRENRSQDRIIDPERVVHIVFFN